MVSTPYGVDRSIWRHGVYSPYGDMVSTPYGVDRLIDMVNEEMMSVNVDRMNADTMNVDMMYVDMIYNSECRYDVSE